MIKNKKINSVVAVVSACSLMAGFTSEAAGSQPEGRVLAVSNENNIVELQRDTFYVMPDTPVVSAKSKIEEEQKKIKGLPKSLGEALDALEADHDYLTKGGVFPQRLIDIWVARKREELRKMEQIPNPAEFKMYYDL